MIRCEITTNPSIIGVLNLFKSLEGIDFYVMMNLFIYFNGDICSYILHNIYSWITIL